MAQTRSCRGWLNVRVLCFRRLGVSVAEAIRGGCLCGSIRYEITRRYLSALHCYCAMCRKAHGGAFSTHVPMRADQFKLTQGALKTYPSSSEGVREFCSNCGTHIRVHGQTKDGSIAVPLGTFDDPSSVTISGHIFVAEKVAWHEIRDSLPQYGAWPPGVEATHLLKQPS